jgi:hypothetical protein
MRLVITSSTIDCQWQRELRERFFDQLLPRHFGGAPNETVRTG